MPGIEDLLDLRHALFPMPLLDKSPTSPNDPLRQPMRQPVLARERDHLFGLLLVGLRLSATITEYSTKAQDKGQTKGVG
jgi:hypothetical protein